MGRDSNVNNPENLTFAGATKPTNTNISPSRLSESSRELRDTLMSRNLYDGFSEYPLQPNTTQKIVNSVSTVLNTVQPFKSSNIADSFFSRLITTPNTPLSDIGLIMVGKQFTLNFASNVAQQTFPQMNLSNILDGNPETKLFSKPKNYSITKKPDGSSFSEFLEDYFGMNFSSKNPFNTNPTNEDYIKNTGPAQLKNLYVSLNRNLYKSEDDTLVEYGNIINEPLEPGDMIIGGKLLPTGEQMTWFNFSNKIFNPYYSIIPYNDGDSFSNTAMRESYRYITEENDEYAPNREFINDNFGDVEKGREKLWVEPEKNEWINKETGFNDNRDNKIIWGKDGVNDYANERIASLRGDVDPERSADLSKFKVHGGLLEYTRNLLNSTRGQVVDQTRKVFTDGKDKEKISGFNGSGLWGAPDTALERFRNTKGLRQHTVLDQYDRFAKAIRFDGNQVYNGGNPNSVIYDSVLPRIHPTINEQTKKIEPKDNKNLMFSIENLAVKVINADDFGIIDDEYGTQIPLSEVGPFNGRIMWFPPYDIELNEVAQANYNSTVMVGRSEPIYTYMHSERNARLSFKLLVDYPPQLKSALINGDHKTISEFFAFGGGETPKESYQKTPSKDQEENDNVIEDVTGSIVKNPPEIIKPKSLNTYFPNDMPTTGEINTIVDIMYKDKTYEVDKTILSSDGTTWGLNNNFYYIKEDHISGSTNPNEKNKLVVPAGFSQYTYEGIQSELDNRIFQTFSNEDLRERFYIEITGKASLLFLGPNEQEYNRKLGQRRADAIKYFIEQRIKKIFGKTAQNLGINIVTRTEGSESGTEEGADPKNINKKPVKEDRSVEISFEENQDYSPRKEVTLTPEETQDVNELRDENTIIDKTKHEQKGGGSTENYVYNKRESVIGSDKDDGILEGFKSVTDNKFYPMFHSQTPEDLHKRLTFLQQCTRQGSAMRSNPNVENGIERAKNSVFGRQPICILRVGDFFYTKVVIETVTIDYSDYPWDTNPEGFGMQPMIADITLNMKIIGGQSLKGPIDALQNAVSFNYYANSDFTDEGMYLTPSFASALQEMYKEGGELDENLKRRVLDRMSESAKAANKKLNREIYDRISDFGNNE